MADVDREITLRSHIRQLLLDYALTHLTTNYITFTEDAVDQLTSQSLRPEVPTHDPSSLAVPTEPFIDLSKLLNLQNLKPIDEKLVVTAESLRYMKDAFTLPGRPRSERCWEKDISDIFEHEYLYYRPMSPILTTRAIRETPKPGSSGIRKSIPSSLPAVLGSFSVANVEPEIIEEPPRINLEDALNLRFSLDPAVVKLIKSNPFLSRTDPKYKNRHVESFLLHDPPTPEISRLESPPLFPRCPIPRNVGVKSGTNLRSLSDLRNILPQVKVEDTETDLYKQHMVVVDGWQTYASSLSPPSRPQTGDSSEIDELFLPSSPDTEVPPIQALMDATMDEVMLPKRRRIGGGEKKGKLGDDQTLASFLNPFISVIPEPSQPAIETMAPNPSPPLSISMQGQPPSPSEMEAEELNDELAGEEDFDIVVEKVYAGTRGIDPKDIVMRETFSERGHIIMDGHLPPPNKHPPSTMYLPTRLADLVVSKSGDDMKGHDLALKKALGIKSLNMELSWIPIKVKPGAKKPTIEDAADVLAFDFLDDSRVKELIQDVSDLAAVDRQVANFEDIAYTCADDYDDEMMLTRAERRRRAGLPELLTDDDDSDKENDERPAKRNRLYQAVDDSGVSFSLPVDSRLGDALSLDDEEDNDKENVRPPSGPHPEYPQPRLRSSTPIHLDGEGLEVMDPAPTGYHHSHLVSNIYQHRDRQAGPDVNEVDPEVFLPLSFDSHAPNSACASQFQQTRRTLSGPSNSFEGNVDPIEADPPSSQLRDGCAILEPDTNTLNDPSRPVLEVHHAMSLTTAVDPLTRNTLSEYVKLRAKTITQAGPIVPTVQHLTAPGGAIPSPSLVTQVVPDCVVDRNTLCLPSDLMPPQYLHRYMASMELVQKQALVRSLRLPQCAVDLVERTSLGGVDLILDPHTAVIYAPLLSLPAECQALCSKIGQQSWRFSRLLVIFEAYPSSHSYMAKSSNGPVPYAFTPPVLKAIRKLRRDLGIAEAYETKCSTTTIQFAFANNVLDAAMFTRYFGDTAEAQYQTPSAIWGDREWLDGEEQEDEHDLACVDGMNNFAAFVILCQVSLQQFLDCDPETRIQEFGDVVGVQRLSIFNQVIANRFQEIEDLDSSEIRL